MVNIYRAEPQFVGYTMAANGKKPTPLQLKPGIAADLEQFRRDRSCSSMAEVVRAHLRIAPQS